jgi:5-methylcytosine-specific restriction endonuclease McrA
MSIRILKDGRVVRSGKDYTELRIAVFLRDKGRCIRCRKRVFLEQQGSDWDMHLAHIHARKMGGGSRDDTKENTITLCAACHRREHNQQSAVPSELKWSRA